MRWLDRIVTRAASGVETRALPGAGAGMGNTLPTPSGPKGGVQASTQPVMYSSPGTPQLPVWDGRAAVEGYYQSVWVQRTLGAIAETVSALPFVAGMDPDDPSATNPQAMLARLLGPATPQAPGGPHNGTSSQAFLQWSIIQKLATGKMAWEYQVDKVAKGPTGQPAIIGLWPLASFLLNPVPSSGGSEWFSGFKYQLPRGEIDLDPARVFYAWKKSQRDWRQPESYLEAAALPISISVAIERYNWALLQNGMVATHVVTAAPLEEPENRRAWEEQFVSNFTGYNQAGKPIFAYADAENGKVTDAFNIQSIAQTSQQGELLALAAWVKNEILVATGVPESLIGNASQRIFANSDAEYRAFWTTRVLNVVMELQDDINTTLAPLLGPEVGWFDLSRVVALQPPTPFAQPQLTDLLAAGIMDVPEAQQQLGVSDSGFIDTSDAPIGEESSTVGPGTSGKASAPRPEMRGAQMWDTSRPALSGWSWEKRGINTTTLKTGIWRPIFRREHVTVRPAPQQVEVIDVASTPIDTRGYEQAERILATVTALREKRTPETPTASTVHHKLGTHGLWKDPNAQLPAYIQNVAKHLIATHGESAGIAMAVGIVRDWSEGHDGHGHKVHPDVQAAAAKAIAEWEALKASHNKSKRAVADALVEWEALKTATKRAGVTVEETDPVRRTATIPLEPRAVAEFGPGGPGAVYAGNNPDSSGAGLLLPLADPKRPKPREAELIGPHRYIPNVGNVKQCAKCGKGPLASVHKDWAKTSLSHPKRTVEDVGEIRSFDINEPRDPFTGKWTQMGDEEKIAHDAKEMEARGVDPEKALAEAHRTHKTYASVGRGTDVRIRPDGTRVDFAEQAKFNDKAKQDVLNAVDSLKALYPEKKVTVAVVDPAVGKALAPNAFGVTMTGSSHIVLTPLTGKPAGQKGHDAGVKAGFSMPAGAGRTAAQYTVAHEFGHTIDTLHGRARPAEVQAILDKYEPGSSYGTKNQEEAFAESFAEWHLSNGTTTDPLTVALAKAEGWRTTATPQQYAKPKVSRAPKRNAAA